MDTIINSFKNAFSNFGDNLVPNIAELVIMFVVFFLVFKFMLDNDAKVLLTIFAIYFFGTSVVFLFTDNTIAYIVLIIAFVLFATTLYSTEIKRSLWNFKVVANDSKHLKDSKNSSQRASECIDEIITALQNMSKNNVGALIVLADNNMPSQVLESGVMINSEISSELIESIFFPKTPLHDGAMIIRKKEIKYAGCFLPLSQELNIPKDLGTRHRAGIGITERINVRSIIVSEENGIISIAKEGKIERYADSDKLREFLSEYYKMELIAER